MQQVILLEKVVGLGNMGETVKVKPGYARNFLLPQGKALPATEANKTKFEAQKAELETKMAESKTAATAVAEQLEGKTVTIERQSSETGQLYGSVNARDIATAITEQHSIDVNRSQVIIGQPIKELGTFDVNIRLHPEVSVKFPVTVNRLTTA